MKTRIVASGLVTLCLQLSGCSKISETARIPLEERGKGLVCLSLSMDGESLISEATKADWSDDDSRLPADHAEKAVNSLTLYLFETGQTCSPDQFHENDGFLSMVKPLNAAELAGTQYLSIPMGDYHVYAVANAYIPVEEDISEAEFRETVVNASSVMASPGQAGLLMVSRRFANMNGDPDGEDMYPREHLSVGLQNLTEPASLHFRMERVVAKVEARMGESAFHAGVSGSDSRAEITMMRALLVNTRNSAYLFRHSRRLYDDQDTFFDKLVPDQQFADYWNGIIVEPRTVDKSLAHEGGFSALATDYRSWYLRGLSQDPWSEEEWTTLGTSFSCLGYCFENTAAHFAQYRGYTTAVVFEATISPEKIYDLDGEGNLVPLAPGIDTGVLYYRESSGRYYGSLDALRADGILSSDDPVILDSWGVKRYTGGVCYYYKWIEHAPNSLPALMGQMQFAIVRNNDYRISVTAVSGPGTGDGEPIIGNPGETDIVTDYPLHADITIQEWNQVQTSTVLG